MSMLLGEMLPEGCEWTVPTREKSPLNMYGLKWAKPRRELQKAPEPNLLF